MAGLCELTDFLFLLRQLDGGVVGFVATEANDSARRRAAFLHETAFASGEEFRKFLMHSDRELQSERI